MRGCLYLPAIEYCNASARAERTFAILDHVVRCTYYVVMRVTGVIGHVLYGN